MNPKKMRPVLLKICMAVILVSLAWPGFAAKKPKNLPSFYPPEFTWVGCIDHITSRFVVIDDYQYRFALGVTFNTPKAPDTSRTWFRPGRKVGIVLNSEKQIESIWYLKRCKRRP